jgi:hypothetical protein
MPALDKVTAMDRIFAQIADYSKTMGGLHNGSLSLVRRDIDRFLEKTDDLSEQMRWQGWTVLGFTALSASLAIAGECVPKSGPAGSNGPTPDPSRLGANDGIFDPISKAMKAITDKLSDHEFLRTTAKTASQGCTGLSQVSEIWYKGSNSKIEAARTLLQSVNIQEGQSFKSGIRNGVDQAQQAGLRLLESKSKGG